MLSGNSVGLLYNSISVRLGKKHYRCLIRAEEGAFSITQVDRRPRELKLQLRRHLHARVNYLLCHMLEDLAGILRHCDGPGNLSRMKLNAVKQPRWRLIRLLLPLAAQSIQHLIILDSLGDVLDSIQTVINVS